MATEAIRYRIYCQDEESYFYVWLSDDDGVPTTCPNNSSHTIDTNQTTIIESITKRDVNISGSTMPSNEHLVTEQHGFIDKTGYNLFIPGYRKIAVAGQTTHFDISYSSDMLLQGMQFKVDGNPVDGDVIDVSMVDVDGVVYPAGTTLVTFADNLNVWANREFKVICEDAKLLYSWVYIRVSYVSNGLNNVAVYLEHYLRTTP